MAHHIVAVRVDIRGDEMRLTSLTESRRGTRTMLKTVQFSGVRGDRSALQGKIRAGVDTLFEKSPVNIQ